MRFGRQPARTRPSPSSPATVPALLPDDGSIPLIDYLGDAFELLRPVDLGLSLWRVQTAADLERLASGQIVVVAAYAPADIDSSRALMQRFMTIILAMGLGPHYGSRALALGAVGYLDAEKDEGTVRGLFGDAVTRVHMRRLRAATA
jgi:hypothetical protein